MMYFEWRKMMQAWGDFIDSLSTGANIIPLHSGSTP